MQTVDALLEDLYQHPIVSVTCVAKLLNMTHAGANLIVNRMAQTGILTEITGRARHRAFRYGGHVDLF